MLFVKTLLIVCFRSFPFVSSFHQLLVR